MIDNFLVIRLSFIFSKLCTCTFSSASYLFRASSSSSLQRSYNLKQLEPSALAFLMTTQGVFVFRNVEKPTNYSGVLSSNKINLYRTESTLCGFSKVHWFVLYRSNGEFMSCLRSMYSFCTGKSGVSMYRRTGAYFRFSREIVESSFSR